MDAFCPEGHDADDCPVRYVLSPAPPAAPPTTLCSDACDDPGHGDWAPRSGNPHTYDDGGGMYRPTNEQGEYDPSGSFYGLVSFHDGQCRDGGPNSVDHLCAYGTDCADCGARALNPPPRAAAAERAATPDAAPPAAARRAAAHAAGRAAHAAARAPATAALLAGRLPVHGHVHGQRHRRPARLHERRLLRRRAHGRELERVRPRHRLHRLRRGRDDAAGVAAAAARAATRCAAAHCRRLPRRRCSR